MSKPIVKTRAAAIPACIQCEGCNATHDVRADARGRYKLDSWPHGWAQCGLTRRFATANWPKRLANWCPTCRTNGRMDELLERSR